MCTDYVLEAMKASIANHEYCTNEEEKRCGMLYKVKYFVWYALLIFLSPHKEIQRYRFVACMTPASEQRVISYVGSSDIFRFARLMDNIHSIRKNISVFSAYGVKRRFAITLQSVAFWIKHKEELKGYFHFILEYYAIAYFLNDYRFKEYISPCMYERYCTLFSYLGRAFGAKLIGVQDGAAINIGIPAKIYCDEMNAFDAFESDIIKTFIKNKDCKYIYTGFVSSLTWEKFQNKSKPIIAIASQDWFTGKTLSLVERIMQNPSSQNYTVMVFPHYRESEEEYNELKSRYPELMVQAGKRYSNIDILITFYSTIVYDFWSINPELDVRCLHIDGYEPGYYKRNHVKVYESEKTLVEGIFQL